MFAGRIKLADTLQITENQLIYSNFEHDKRFNEF